MKPSIFFFLFSGLLLSGCTSSTTEPLGKDAVLEVNRTNDFTVNGNGDHPAWDSAAWISLPRRDSAGVTYKTFAKLLYSGKGIYILFRCEDYKISASLRQDNADLYKEDVAEIFFWTSEEYPIYFEYEISPLNYELVLMVPNFDGRFLGWIPWHYSGDRTTEHAVTIQTDDGGVSGWTAEVFIPYELLKPLRNVPPSPGTEWRMNMYRIDYDYGSAEWAWQPVRETFHDFKAFGTLRFR